MPASSRTVDRPPDDRLPAGRPAGRRRDRRRGRRRWHPADALVLVAVAVLVAGLGWARSLGLAPPQAAPPSTTAAPRPEPFGGDAVAGPVLPSAAATAAEAALVVAARTAPVVPVTRSKVIEFERWQPTPAAAVAEPAFTVRAPSRRDPVRVLVLGDALAAGVADGLARLGPESGLTVRARTVASSGLARPDVYDWPAQAGSVVAPSDELVVLAVGLNDAQTLVRAISPTGAVGSATWVEAYRARLAGVLAGLGPRPVVLMGLPTVESTLRDRELETVRAALAAEAADHPNVRWLDVRPATSAEDGSFARWLDAGDGGQVAARSNDGERFTDAGNDVLARTLVDAVWPPAEPG